ncbi:MAG TPA: MFS transporter [Bacteroidales bacterium]|nr:MFS transporter [Bacteroidales bacterium]HPS16407.1 MFS transporter [Bacteroidales bacterium]
MAALFRKNNNEHDPYAALRIKNFRYFLLARFSITVALQMQSIIVGWQVYEITKDPFSLGLIGLAEAIPYIFTSLFSGYFADRYNRKNIILITTTVFIISATLLYLFTANLSNVLFLYGVVPIYLVVAFSGFARSFIYAAQTALMAQLVPRELYANSSTWNSTNWHIAAVSGPAIGGLIYGFYGISNAYLTVIIFVILGFYCFININTKKITTINYNSESVIASLTEGIRFVFKNQIILGALSLDMLAVLFGGAVAMLPVFAAEVLHVGPQGLGFLRAAPAAGAVIMSFFLAYNPPVRNSGKKLFISVAGFGLCIIFFAISKNFYLSLLLLAMSGMFDNVSVIIRHTIMQLYTPNNMRGRVAAVNSIFIGSSNEIGSFESGLAARIMGLIPSVIFGGSMTLIITATAAKVAPLLRKLHLKE